MENTVDFTRGDEIYDELASVPREDDVMGDVMIGVGKMLALVVVTAADRAGVSTDETLNDLIKFTKTYIPNAGE